MNSIKRIKAGIKNVNHGRNVTVIEPVNLYDCVLEDGVFVGPFVEIQKGAVIKRGTRISSHSFIPSGVTIGENTFIGHGVMFTNDKFDSTSIKNWNMKKTVVGNNVRIGSNATILPDIYIGDHAIIGAGAVVTKSVPAHNIVYGNPAK
jgi:acetyltransferase-like isoleucine patch superfamily enzyme